MTHTDYEKMSDEELVSAYHGGQAQAADYIVKKYEKLVEKSARAFFLLGADKEDLIQEGRMGLYKAIRDYDSERDASFSTFANLCVARQIRTAVSTYSRKKNTPLNNSISLDGSDDECSTEDDIMMNALDLCRELNPETVFLRKEQKSDIMEQVYDKLSNMEIQVLELYMAGLSYQQIAQKLDKPVKSIDNAIQRIRAKALTVIR